MENEKVRKEFQLQTILALIVDAQEAVRFLETKTAICVTILSAHFVGLYSMLERLTKEYGVFPWWFWCFLITLLIIHTFIILLTYQIIAPRINPLLNVPHDPEDIPAKSLFLLNGRKSSWLGFSHTLTRSFKEFSTSYNSLSPDDLIKAATFEYMKVSYIRNAKADRFRILAQMLFLASGIFFSLLVVFFSV